MSSALPHSDPHRQLAVRQAAPTSALLSSVPSSSALSLWCLKVMSRTAFGKPLVEHSTILADIAQSRVDIEQARLLVLKAAHLMDVAGNKVGGFRGDRHHPEVTLASPCLLLFGSCGKAQVLNTDDR